MVKNGDIRWPQRLTNCVYLNLELFGIALWCINNSGANDRPRKYDEGHQISRSFVYRAKLFITSLFAADILM